MNSSNGIKLLNIVLIVIPVLCVVIGLVQIYGNWRTLGELSTEQLTLQHEISVADRALSNNTDMPSYQQVPTAEQTAAEQARFLDQLHGEARATGAQITTWANTTPVSNQVLQATPPPAPGSPPAPAQPQQHTLPSGVNPITSQVEVVGTFQSLRQFLYRLQRTPRLLNLSNPRWTRETWPRTRLSFLLTRYVTPEAAPIQISSNKVADLPTGAPGAPPATTAGTTHPTAATGPVGAHQSGAAVAAQTSASLAQPPVH